MGEMLFGTRDSCSKIQLKTVSRNPKKALLVKTGKRYWKFYFFPVTYGRVTKLTKT
jgi:hypothetical protein